jgi:hypothetical protein
VQHFARAGDEHVQPATAAGLADGAEVAAELAVLVRAVRGADDQVIALVALDVFQVLDEQTFARILAPAAADA